MKLQFRYTLGDLQETLFFTDAGDAKRQRTAAGGLIGWITFVVIATLLFVFLRVASPSNAKSATAPQNPPADLILDLVTTMIPVAVILLILVIALWRSWRNSRWSPRIPDPTAKSSRIVRQVVSSFALLLLALAILLLFNPNITFLWYASRGDMVLLRIGPWAVVFILLIAFSLLYRQWQPRQQWLANPAYRREKVLELNDQAARLSDSLLVMESKWENFIMAWETPNFLFLVAEDKRRWMIPKRAFSDESEIDRARALIQNKIADSRFLVQPGGFAVVPKPVVPVSEEERMSHGS